VVYMGVTNLASICRTLIRLGKSADTPAALVESGTLASQRTQVATLETIAAVAANKGASPPALLIVGSVVALREAVAWYEQLPLFGQRIVVTRPQEETARSAAVLEALGAEVLVAPTVALRPITDTGPLDAAIEHLAEYDWLVFTSAAGVRFFLRRLKERGGDLRALGHVKLAAIGPTTADALAQFHLKADLVPDSYRSESLAEALGLAACGRKILLARADRGRPLLKDVLQKLADVDQVAVYHHADAESLPDAVVERILNETVDWITLTSSAITTRFYSLLPEAARHRIGRDVRLASLSPVTTETATGLGWSVAAEAAQFTWEGLVQALIETMNEEKRTARDAG